MSGDVAGHLTWVRTAARRYGSLLAATDQERILAHVKDISQRLNLAWDAHEY